MTSALHQLVRAGATELCALVLEAELQEFLELHRHALLRDGGRAVVRNGYLPERMLVTCAGEIPIRVPRTRDRGGSGAIFTSRLLPPYHSRFRVEPRLPEVWLRSFIDGSVFHVLGVLLGPQVALLPQGLMKRIDAEWKARLAAWRRRSPANVEYLSWWAGTVGGRGLSPLLPFIVGMTHDGEHELVAVSAVPAAATRGEHANAWFELLHALRERHPRSGAQLCEAEDLPGFQEALHQFFPGTLARNPQGLPKRAS